MASSVHPFCAARHAWRYAAAMAAALPILGWQAVCAGADHVFCVEEDWELVVDEPEQGVCAPQVTCTMAPTALIDQGYAAFDLNHRSQPGFVAGGMQLHVWSPAYPLASAAASKTGMLRHSGETVCWTQRMVLFSHVLYFSIADGQSQTWGAFNSSHGLAAMVATSLENLDQYSPEVSAEHSGIGYAANRVQSLKLLRVRRYWSSGAVTVDETVRVVHER